MTYKGTVRGGVVVLPPDAALPDGLEVDVCAPAPSDAPPSGPAVDDGPTLYERFKDIVGIAQGLPHDFADQHDHYIHGTPKRSRE